MGYFRIVLLVYFLLCFQSWVVIAAFCKEWCQWESCRFILKLQFFFPFHCSHIMCCRCFIYSSSLFSLLCMNYGTRFFARCAIFLCTQVHFCWQISSTGFNLLLLFNFRLLVLSIYLSVASVLTWSFVPRFLKLMIQLSSQVSYYCINVFLNIWIWMDQLTCWAKAYELMWTVRLKTMREMDCGILSIFKSQLTLVADSRFMSKDPILVPISCLNKDTPYWRYAYVWFVLGSNVLTMTIFYPP